MAEPVLGNLMLSALMLFLGAICARAGLNGLRGRDTYHLVGDVDMNPISGPEPPVRGSAARWLGAFYLIVAVIALGSVVAIWR